MKNLSNFYGNGYMFTFWLIAVVIYLAINLTVSWIGRRSVKFTQKRTP